MRFKISFLIAFIFLISVGSASSVHAAADIGDLVKCSDFSSVYYFAEDGNRYAFPNERTYFTWYKDFEDVKTISCDDLAELDLAGNVTYQAGTRLLKLQSVPTVYFVEPSGVLRAIQSEDQAEALFGDNWADRVDDLPDAFYPAYELGDDIEDGELPEGLIIEDEDGALLRIDDQEVAVEIDDLLDSDENEELFKKFAVESSQLEIKLKIEISGTNFSNIDISELTALLEALQTINVDDEFEIEVEIEIEEEDESDDNSEEADEEIGEAIGEIERAQNRIRERHQNGKSVTEAEGLLQQAQEFYALALEAYQAGDYDLAEQYAEDSQEYAEDARMGSAVNSIDDDDDDEDEDDSTDEIDSSDEEDGDEEDSSDETDEVDDENDDEEDSEDSTD